MLKMKEMTKTCEANKKTPMKSNVEETPLMLKDGVLMSLTPKSNAKMERKRLNFMKRENMRKHKLNNNESKEIIADSADKWNEKEIYIEGILKVFLPIDKVIPGKGLRRIFQKCEYVSFLDNRTIQIRCNPNFASMKMKEIRKARIEGIEIRYLFLKKRVIKLRNAADEEKVKKFYNPTSVVKLGESEVRYVLTFETEEEAVAASEKKIDLGDISLSLDKFYENEDPKKVLNSISKLNLQQMAQCVEWFIETKSDTQVQHNVRENYTKPAPTKKGIASWYKMFKEWGSLIPRKPKSRQQIASLSDEHNKLSDENSKINAQCVEWFIETKSVKQVLHNIRENYKKTPPAGAAIRDLYNRFKKTGSVRHREGEWSIQTSEEKVKSEIPDIKQTPSKTKPAKNAQVKRKAEEVEESDDDDEVEEGEKELDFDSDSINTDDKDDEEDDDDED